MVELLRREIALACLPDHAFRVFMEQVDLWWPRGHRRFRDGSLRFDSGRLVDRAASGEEWTMAEVLDRLPPSRLHLAWFPGSPNAPTDVEIAFAAEGTGTRVTIVHRPLSAPAEAIWSARVATFRAGWDAVGLALADFIVTEAETHNAENP